MEKNRPEYERQIAILNADFHNRKNSEEEKLRQVENEIGNYQRQISILEETKRAIRGRIEDLIVKFYNEMADLTVKFGEE